MSEKTWTPYNGKSTTISRVIEAVVVAAIVGGITLWGNARVMDVKIASLCDAVSDIKVVTAEIKTSQVESKIDRALMRSDIKGMIDRLEGHVKQGK